MKRLCTLGVMLILVFSILLPGSALASSDVLSYRFEFQAGLLPDHFPRQLRSRIMGYTEMLASLRFYGNVIYVPSTRSLDLHLTVEPLGNPEAAISCRLFGIPSHEMLSSPLLGDQTLFFNNIALMDFAHKTYLNLNIPLQYLAVLFPFASEYAFSRLTQAWNAHMDGITSSLDAVSSLSSAWQDIVFNDQALLSWLAAMTADVGCAGAVYGEFSSLPSYFLNTVCSGQPLLVSVTDEMETWSNASHHVLMTRSLTEPVWSLTLPETEAGYLPRTSFSRTLKENQLRFSFSADYSLSNEKRAALSENSADDHEAWEEETDIWNDDTAEDSSLQTFQPDTLLCLTCTGEGLPTVWPSACASSVSLSVTGAFLPNFAAEIHAQGTEAGALSLSLCMPMTEDSSSTEIMTLTGTLLPEEPSWIPVYNMSEILQHINIFSISDETLNVFLHQIARPCFLGVLSFIDMLPAAACQSIMDDLDDFGILNMILST